MSKICIEVELPTLQDVRVIPERGKFEEDFSTEELTRFREEWLDDL